MRGLLADDSSLRLSETLREQLKDKVGRSLNPPIAQATISLYERDAGKLVQCGAPFAIPFFEANGLTGENAVDVARQLIENLAALLRPRSSEGLPDVTEGRVINVYAAGKGPAWGDTEVLEQVSIPGIEGDRSIGLMASGDSMAPYLWRGDIAIVECDDGLETPGDMCAVWIADDGCVIERLVAEHPNGALLLESINPNGPAERFFTAPMGSRVIGKVVRRLLKDWGATFTSGGETTTPR